MHAESDYNLCFNVKVALKIPQCMVCTFFNNVLLDILCNFTSAISGSDFRMTGAHKQTLFNAVGRCDGTCLFPLIYLILNKDLAEGLFSGVHTPEANTTQ